MWDRPLTLVLSTHMLTFQAFAVLWGKMRNYREETGPTKPGHRSLMTRASGGSLVRICSRLRAWIPGERAFSPLSEGVPRVQLRLKAEHPEVDRAGQTAEVLWATLHVAVPPFPVSPTLLPPKRVSSKSRWFREDFGSTGREPGRGNAAGAPALPQHGTLLFHRFGRLQTSSVVPLGWGGSVGTCFSSAKVTKHLHCKVC